MLTSLRFRLAALGMAMTLAAVMIVLSACTGGEAPEERSGVAVEESIGAAGAIDGGDVGNIAGDISLGEGSSDTEPATDDVVIGVARWRTLDASSLKKMAATHDLIVVGQVTLATDITFAETASDDDQHPDGDAPPPDHPKAKVSPVLSPDPLRAPRTTLYSVQVLQIIGQPRLGIGDTISVGQVGGTKDGVAYHLENDPVMQVGATYLFFLREDVQGVPDVWVASPFGRFQLAPDGRLQPADSVWLYLPAVANLTGRTLDQAVLALETTASQR